MYELSPSQQHRIEPLLSRETPGYLFARALLERNHQGRVLADDVVEPATILVVLACGFNYLAGRADDLGTLQAMKSWITRHLASDDGYLLLFPTSLAWEEQLPVLFSDAAELIQAGRIEYSFDEVAYARRHLGWRKALPEGYVVRRYDRVLAEGQDLAEFWGSIDAFLRHGFGFAVTQGDEVVSRCHTVLVGAKMAEISISTAEPYRRRGFATRAACAFIDHCLAIGVTPAWSCWDNNTVSRYLAEHLGFVQENVTRAYVVRLV